MFFFAGGTIDVTSYEVQTNSKLRELDKPSGGPWGGICVDQEYVNTLQKIFSTEVWENFSEIVPEDYLLIERQFEAKKRGIGLNSERKIIISFPSSLFETFSKLRPNITLDDNLKALGLSEKIRKKSDKLIINPEIVKPFFRSIDDIILHVKNLLLVAREKGNKIRTILVVGGYADSPVLQEKLREEFKPYNIIYPEEAVLAVLKGAVMFGHNPNLISERICQRTYGIASNAPFDYKKHPYTHRLVVEGREMCTDIFKIMVRKSDTLIVGKSSFSIQCSPSYSNDTLATVEVYESNEKEPQYTTDKGVKKLGEVIIPIPDIMLGKSRTIRVTMHFGYTELLVTASEEGTDRKAQATFDCMLK